MINKVGMGEYKVMDILAICQKLNILWRFENCCEHRTIWGWKFQNATPPTVCIQFEPNFMINKAVIRAYNVMDISTICQKVKKNMTL